MKSSSKNPASRDLVKRKQAPPVESQFCQATQVVRDERGRIVKGHSLNPAGRKQGSRNRASLAAQSLIDGRAEALINLACMQAARGDSLILKCLLDRILPPKRDAPIELDLPKIKNPSDLGKASKELLRALAAGEVTPSEASTVAALLDQVRDAVLRGDEDRERELMEELGL